MSSTMQGMNKGAREGSSSMYKGWRSRDNVPKGLCFLFPLPHCHQSAQVGACTSRALTRSPGPLCNPRVCMSVIGVRMHKQEVCGQGVHDKVLYV